MKKLEFRSPQDFEVILLKAMIEKISSGKSALDMQINSCQVRSLDDMGSLEIRTNIASTYGAYTGPLVTAQQEDVDTISGCGPYINVLLFLKDGKLEQLEVYKDDGSPPQRKIQADSLSISLRNPI
ncbi:hypothetical protein AB4851_30125 [Burkholderia sp. 22PA0099]|uniref:DUF6984 family protein n=1 Tax=Burkholderia sp. 22PA0099 TaxID=3237372 RepID=UPI0039C43308